MIKRRLIILSLFIAIMAGEVAAQQMQWQEVKHAVAVDDSVDISGGDGVIIVRTNRRIQVRVFTILGQLVNQATLNPGESQLRVNSRGIYIVKIENRTQKVAL